MLRNIKKNVSVYKIIVIVGKAHRYCRESPGSSSGTGGPFSVGGGGHFPGVASGLLCQWGPRSWTAGRRPPAVEDPAGKVASGRRPLPLRFSVNVYYGMGCQFSARRRVEARLSGWSGDFSDFRF